MSSDIESKSGQKIDKSYPERVKKDEINAKRDEIDGILKIYDNISQKLDAILPLLSEVALLAIDFDNKVKYNSYLKYRFRTRWVVQTVIVAQNQIQKLVEYMKLVNVRNREIVSEFTEQESAFE